MIEKEVVAEVALHLVGEKANFKNNPYQLRIQKSATEAFAAEGLSPKRLLDEDDRFYINEWIKDAEECAEENMVNVDLVQKLGKLLAKIHTVKSDWYAPYYQELLENYPEPADVPRGSSFWYLTARSWPLLFGCEHKGSMDKWIKRLIHGYKTYLECEIQPVSPAGQNIVTTHGDYHLGNIVRSHSEGFKVVDFEQTHVSSAIQDITYFFFALSSIFKPRHIRLEFCEAYLKEMGYPSEESDAFTLALDAERCFLSVGFMSPLFQAFVTKENLDKEDETSLKRLKSVADMSLKDNNLAEKFLETGIAKQLPFICFGNRLHVGALVTMGSPDSDEGENTSEDRYQFLINGDGTIMPKTKEPWKGLVLGSNKYGDVVLTNHCNSEERLVLSDEIHRNTPIKGYPKLKTPSFPLLLKGSQHAGKAICRNKQKSTWQGVNIFNLAICDVKDAAIVHFEEDGSIRFSDKPEQGIDCEAGRYTSGTAVHIFQYHGSKNQKFVRNEDDTISPKENLKVIIALRKGSLELRDKNKVTEEERLVFDIPEGIGYAAPINDSEVDENKKTEELENESNSFKLILSHPEGRGISFRPLELDDDTKSLLEVEPSTKSLSKFKLCIVDQADAANAKLDLKNNYIKITKNSTETSAGSNSDSMKEGQTFIRVGCWKKSNQV